MEAGFGLFGTDGRRDFLKRFQTVLRTPGIRRPDADVVGTLLALDLCEAAFFKRHLSTLGHDDTDLLPGIIGYFGLFPGNHKEHDLPPTL